MSELKVSILGAGNIAKTMARTVQAVEGVTLWGVASRSLDKAEEFAAKFGAPRAFGSYEELYEDPDTDLIYIATPHMFHFEQAREALLHGKHALCEKPMTINAAQAEELFALAEERGLFVSEAIWTRYLPLGSTLREKLESGVIGTPKVMTANYGFNCAGVPRMEEPSLAGGALLDLGIYPLTVISMAFGEEISGMQTTGVLTEKGVDAHSVTTLTFEDGRMATVFTAMDATLGSKAVIYGDAGRIELNPVCNWNRLDIYDGSGRIKERISCPQQITGFEYEVQAAVKAIEAGALETEEAPRSLLLAMMRRMDSLRSIWGMRYPGEE
ncbi:MAG: Gfo/Idh/MocA family oxidoreductase [Oscillospiraceae bacterium]|nr:Gfo/Idh/MocA family oxidoreductase [Oscillospiraceae bacterium]